MLLYHLANLENAEAIATHGFVNEVGTYKATGMALDGVFFSASMLDSNEDDPGSVVFAVRLEESLVTPYEIIEADSDHRKFSIPADLANTVPRERLTIAEARAVPQVDRANDPAFPPV